MSTRSWGTGRGNVRNLIAAIRLFLSEGDTHVRVLLAAATCFALIASALTALAPVALKLIVDSLATPQGGGTYLAPALIIAAYVLSQWLGRSFDELRLGVYSRGEQRLVRHLSRRMFAHTMGLPLAFHLERKTGALCQILANGSTGYRIVLNHVVFTIAPVVVQLGAIAVVLTQLGHPSFLAIISVSVVAYGAAFATGVVRISGPARAVSATSLDATALLTDSLLNLEAVKYFDAESQVRDRYDRALARTESRWAEFYTHRTLNGLAIAAVFGLSLAATIGLAAREVHQGTMTLGDFVLVNSYILQVVRPLEMIGYAIRDLTQGLAFIEKLLDLFRQKTEAEALAHKIPALDNFGGNLRFSRLRFSYRPGRQILNDVSFGVASGKTIALVGPSGCGKSTLIRLLLRLLEPDSGQIFLDEVAVSEWPISTLRKAVAVVPQDTVLFNDTIAYNIAFGTPDSRPQEIEQAAKLADIHEFVSALPDRYETLVGERGIKLSGGEKQRIAIARAVLKKPRVFVFDEATSSLDSRTERAILRNLIGISRGVTTLFIAHRLSTIVHVDEILIMDRGDVVERGPHRILLQQGGLYAAMWRAQQRDQPSSYDEPLAGLNGAYLPDSTYR